MSNEDAHRIAALVVASHLATLAMCNAHGGPDQAWKAAVAAYHGDLQRLQTAVREMAIDPSRSAAPAVFAGPDEPLEAILADLRRLYHHVHGGGSVRREDAERISRGIGALERAQARQHALVAA